jgi:Ca2+-binding EF-hand superfamily protein
MDSDGSGALDSNEFKRALSDYKVGCSDEEADALFAIFDKNRDGTIDFEEFMHAVIGGLNEIRRSLVE